MTIIQKHKIPHDMTLLVFGWVQKAKKLQKRRKIIGPWTILEKASRSYNITRKSFLNHGDLSSRLWWSKGIYPTTFSSYLFDDVAELLAMS